MWFVFSFSVSTQSFSFFYLWSDCVVCFFFQRQYPVPFMFLPAKWFWVFWWVFPESVASPTHFFTCEMMGRGGGGGGKGGVPVSTQSLSFFTGEVIFFLSRVRTQSLSFCLPVKWLFFQSHYPVPVILFTCEVTVFPVTTQSLSFCLPVKWLFFQSHYPVPVILFTCEVTVFPESLPSPCHFVYLWSDCFSRVTTQSLSFCLPVKWLFFQSLPSPCHFVYLWSDCFSSHYPVPVILFTCEVTVFPVTTQSLSFCLPVKWVFFFSRASAQSTGQRQRGRCCWQLWHQWTTWQKRAEQQQQQLLW